LAIQSFSDADTQSFFVTGRVARRVGWQGVAKVARRKLDMIHYAARLDDLRSPPGNRLEALRGTRAGYHSVRINERWRIIFRWLDAGPTEVAITDYH
jgi:proteic killer suppression protein